MLIKFKTLVVNLNNAISIYVEQEHHLFVTRIRFNDVVYILASGDKSHCEHTLKMIMDHYENGFKTLELK